MTLLSEHAPASPQEAHAATPEADSWDVTPNEKLSTEFAADTQAVNETRAASEASPAGSSVLAAAHRLEQWAISRAHGEALHEYRKRDEAGYVDHLAQLADSPEATPRANAYAQLALQREHSRTDREEMMEHAKVKLRGIGHAAVSHLRDAGLITVGAGLLTGEAAGRKVKAGYDAAVGAKFHFDARREDRAFRRDSKKEMKAFDKASAQEAKAQQKQAAKELKAAAKQDRRFERDMNKKVRVEARHERAQQRAAAARQRRNARREKWTEVKYIAIGTKELAKDAAKEKLAVQKAKLAHFALRARAAGEAWKNYQ